MAFSCLYTILMNIQNNKSSFSLYKKNISITTLCARIFANKPTSFSHHIFKFYNELYNINFYVWILSGISWVIFYSIVSDTFVIAFPGILTIIQQTVMTVAILWLLFMFLKWDCYIDIAKFIGCINIRKAKRGGLLWSERHEHYPNTIHLQKQTGLSLAVAMRSAVIPLSFFLSLSLTLNAAHKLLPVFNLVSILGIVSILGCLLLFFVLWLYWSIIYIFLFKWIVEYIIKYYIYKSHPDLKTSGYTVLWNVFVRK